MILVVVAAVLIVVGLLGLGKVLAMSVLIAWLLVVAGVAVALWAGRGVLRR